MCESALVHLRQRRRETDDERHQLPGWQGPAPGQHQVKWLAAHLGDDDQVGAGTHHIAHRDDAIARGRAPQRRLSPDIG